MTETEMLIIGGVSLGPPRLPSGPKHGPRRDAARAGDIASAASG